MNLRNPLVAFPHLLARKSPAAASWVPARKNFMTERCAPSRTGAADVELIRPEGTQE